MQGQDPQKSFRINLPDSESCMPLRQCKHGKPRVNTANHSNNAELRTDLGSKCYFTSRKVEYKLKNQEFFEKRVTNRASAAGAATLPSGFLPAVLSLSRSSPPCPLSAGLSPGRCRVTGERPGPGNAEGCGAGQGDTGASPLEGGGCPADGISVPPSPGTGAAPHGVLLRLLRPP